MRRAVHRRQNDQLGLFHPPRHSPTWQNLPTQLKEQTVKLLAQMLRQKLVRHVRGDAAREACDE